jgi:hypothetical protein
MREATANLGTKTLALAVLLVAAWVLFKVILGFLTGVAWILLVVGSILAVMWALNKLF